jgi:hypothetical protein
MDTVNEDYWYNQWQNDYELHNLLCIRNITPINKTEQVSIYADTDSLFVSFKPAIDHCDWNNLIFDRNYLSSLNEKFIILTSNEMSTSNSNCVGIANNVSELEELIKNDYDLLLVDGHFVKDRKFNKMVDDGVFTSDIKWNWSNETDLIQGMDHYRYAGYFKKCLEDYAGSFGVDNKEDFELERISESIINIAKKKYIQHILFEDGIPYDRLNYIYPKGVELRAC